MGIPIASFLPFVKNLRWLCMCDPPWLKAPSMGLGMVPAICVFDEDDLPSPTLVVSGCDMMRADDFLRKMTMARRSDAFLALGEDYVVVDPLRLPPFSAAIAAETVGKDADCDDASRLGVWDGLLVDCPHPPNHY